MSTGGSVVDSYSPQLVRTGIEDVVFGKDVTVVLPTNLYGCALGNDVFVGPFVEIQRGVTIGSNTRIQSHSFICEMVSIGSDCFIGHGVVFVNDKLRGGPARGDRSLWQSTVIGDRVSIGSNASVLPVNICSDVVVGAGAVVTSDICEPGSYIGNPARLL